MNDIETEACLVEQMTLVAGNGDTRRVIDVLDSISRRPNNASVLATAHGFSGLALELVSDRLAMQQIRTRIARRASHSNSGVVPPVAQHQSTLQGRNASWLQRSNGWPPGHSLARSQG